MVISVLVVALVYSPAATTFYVFAAPPSSGFLNSTNCAVPPAPLEGKKVHCCWEDSPAEGITFLVCQECTYTQDGYSDCNKPGIIAQQPPTPPPSGPAAPLQDGGVLQQTPGQGVAPPLTRGQGVLPQDGVLQQQQPADEEVARTVEPPTEDETTQPTQEPLPCPEGQVLDEESGLCVIEDCPEGQVLDEESGLCVLEEQDAAEEPTTEEDQSSEESDSEEDNGNN